MKEKGALRAAFEAKCPKCRTGELFPEPIYRSPFKMHTHCPKCGLQFEREPGFFYGAMYVSYAFSVAIFITTLVVLYVLFDDPDMLTYILTITIVALILYPFTFRYSRIIFMYVFGDIRYNPEKVK